MQGPTDGFCRAVQLDPGQQRFPSELIDPAELETWMTAPAHEAMALQRPIDVRLFEIVAKRKKSD
ncbi:hypothetical protein [Sulfitobacter guttiformis]|jgi:putative SOS response-associated peptidase YedK|uniref:hypothetical protein n=1 Tax=Sulfitobacter guttiformis TaxID=74349 RepID=UPI00046A0072|nr:hypothetical protein [Sulfitobacter guttiformis]KIN74236.1 hypothetical protein Z949_3432 [Sulfitobacter guttiformis KCTC 32187]